MPPPISTITSCELLCKTIFSSAIRIHYGINTFFGVRGDIMQTNTIQTLQIGLIGPPALLRYDILQLQDVQLCAQDPISVHISIQPIYHPMQISDIDGLLITDWHYPSLCRRLYPLQKSILHRQEQLSLWGIAAGAAAMGRNNLLPVLNCTIVSHPCSQLNTAILELPGLNTDRFVGYFVPDIIFSTPGPNLGILCQNQTHGTVAIRQGNHLASGFAAELTPNCALYPYWLEMVASLKEWKI